MFFNKIADYSQKKLRLLYAIFELIYFGLMMVAPIIIINWKYGLFTKVEAGTKLTGVGIITVLVVAIISLRAIKKQINEVPEITLKQQRFKYSMQLVYALSIPVIILVVLSFMRSNFELAYNTLKWCSWYFIGGIAVDYLFIKYLQAEMKLRSKAQELNEVDKRRKYFK